MQTDTTNKQSVANENFGLKFSLIPKLLSVAIIYFFQMANEELRKYQLHTW